MAELAAHYQLAPAQSRRWKLHLRQQAAQVFAQARAPVRAPPDMEPRYAAIGRWQLETARLKNRSPDEPRPPAPARASPTQKAP